MKVLMKGTWALWVAVAFLQGNAVWGAAENPASNTSSAAADRNGQTNQVRAITLPHFEPDLPIAAGRDEYLAVCVSCHSPRYVTMQPLFPQRQWEETVDKMVKVYGAQMDQSQRKSIVEYLVATHGPDSTPGAPAAEEDELGATTVPPASFRAESVPLLKLTDDPVERAVAINRGSNLFKEHCAGCHGSAGKGDGWVSQALLRPPKDLTAIRFSWLGLSQTLWNGKRGTAMPSWRTLSEPDLAGIAAFVMTLHSTPKSERFPPVTALQSGRQVFQQNCAPCHGSVGDGRGTAGAALLPEPANFKLKQPDFEYILQVVRDGVPGTAMPAWKNQISDLERGAVADFVRSLFDPANSAEH